MRNDGCCLAVPDSIGRRDDGRGRGFCYEALLKSTMYPPLVRAAFKPGARPVELDSDQVWHRLAVQRSDQMLPVLPRVACRVNDQSINALAFPAGAGMNRG